MKQPRKRTVIVSLVIIILLCAVGFLGWKYYKFSEEISNMKKQIEKYEKRNEVLELKIDSTNKVVRKRESRIQSMKDSILVIDSLYKENKDDIDSVKRYYNEKRIPAIDSYTVDSIIRYFRSRYQ